MQNNNAFKVGDLIALKGFERLSIQEKPIGIIIKLSSKYALIDWTNQVLADRFALDRRMPKTKIELV
jgi:hypothetical protein|tara:strand:- start:467 stop:667 length:201 start_codon:yes stop_codon:yes gene_type:complete